MPNSTTYRKSGATAVYPVVGGITLKSTTDIDDGWYHIAITLTRNGTSYIYINGTAEDSVSMYNYRYRQVGNLYLGADYEAEKVIGAKCYIDDFAVWKIALKSTDISSIYNSGSPNNLMSDASYSEDDDQSAELLMYYEMESIVPPGVELGIDDSSSSGAYFMEVEGNTTVTNDEVPSGGYTTKSLVFPGDSQDSGTHDYAQAGTFTYPTPDVYKWYGKQTGGVGMNGIFNNDASISFWFKWDDGHPETFPTGQNYLITSGDPSNISYDNFVFKFNNSDKKIEFIFNEYQT